MTALQTKRSAAFSALEAQLYQVTDPSGAVNGAHGLVRLLELMKGAESSDTRLLCLNVLTSNTHENRSYVNQVLQIGGVSVLSRWIMEHRKATTEEEQQLLHTALHCLSMLTVSMELVAETGIGRTVSCLARCPKPEVATEAESLIAKWKAALTYEPEKRVKLDEFTSPDPSLPARASAIQWVDETLVTVKYFLKNDEPNAECASQRPLPEFFEESFERMTTQDYRAKECMMERDSNRRALDSLTPRIHYSSLLVQRVQKSTRAAVDSNERAEVSKQLQRSRAVLYERESDIPRCPQDRGVSEIGCIPIVPLERVRTNQIGTAVKMLEMAPPQPEIKFDFLPFMMADSLYQNKAKVKFDPITKKPQNYRTLPCLKFHSTEGCIRGDNCHFIHDFDFAGRPIPNFREWRQGRDASQGPSYRPPRP